MPLVGYDFTYMEATPDGRVGGGVEGKATCVGVLQWLRKQNYYMPPL